RLLIGKVKERHETGLAPRLPAHWSAVIANRAGTHICLIGAAIWSRPSGEFEARSPRGRACLEEGVDPRTDARAVRGPLVCPHRPIGQSERQRSRRTDRSPFVSG